MSNPFNIAVKNENGEILNSTYVDGEYIGGKTSEEITVMKRSGKYEFLTENNGTVKMKSK